MERRTYVIKLAPLKVTEREICKLYTPNGVKAFKVPFNDLTDIGRIKCTSYNFVDNGKEFIEIVRRMAILTGVAPVCYSRQCRGIKVYGEKSQLAIFHRIISTLINYYSDNSLSRVNPDKAKVPESTVRSHYRLARKQVYNISNELKVSIGVVMLRTQYLYSLYLYVAKLEKLNPKKWGFKQEENMGYHYVTKRFFNKRILG